MIGLDAIIFHNHRNVGPEHLSGCVLRRERWRSPWKNQERALHVCGREILFQPRNQWTAPCLLPLVSSVDFPPLTFIEHLQQWMTWGPCSYHRFPYLTQEHLTAGMVSKG